MTNDSDTTISAPNAPRRAWLAALLSLLAIGTGHLYCGRAKRGFVWLLISLFLAVSFQLSISFLPVSVANPMFCLLLCITVLVYLSVAIDSFRIARRTRSYYELKSYNHWYTYLASIIFVRGTLLLLAFCFSFFVIQLCNVDTSSDHPTIQAGDSVLIKKLAYMSSGPKRGDMIAFDNPSESEMIFMVQLPKSWLINQAAKACFTFNAKYSES